jgi:hypothetical protein
MFCDLLSMLGLDMVQFVDLLLDSLNFMVNRLVFDKVFHSDVMVMLCDLHVFLHGTSSFNESGFQSHGISQ